MNLACFLNIQNCLDTYGVPGNYLTIAGKGNFRNTSEEPTVVRAPSCLRYRLGMKSYTVI